MTPANTIPGDGTFRVGIDVAPGTYKSSGGTSPSGSCYWYRHATVGGSNDILDSNSSTGTTVRPDRTNRRDLRNGVLPTLGSGFLAVTSTERADP